MSDRPRHVVVTGASSGIGEALVREWVRAGAAVTLVARRRELMEEIVRSTAGVAGKTQIVAADLGDIATCTDWLAAAEAVFGPVDVLVNNAGVQIVDDAARTDFARAEQLLRVDLIAPMKLTRTVLPGMLERRAGCIVDVASMAALAPTPGMWFYNAAKGGLAAASESLRGELRGTGVHVVTVYPGPVETPMARAGYSALEPTAGARFAPKGTPEVLARRVRRAVERRRARVIYPWIYTFARHLPGITRWAMDHFSPRVAHGQTQGQLPPKP